MNLPIVLDTDFELNRYKPELFSRLGVHPYDDGSAPDIISEIFSDFQDAIALPVLAYYGDKSGFTSASIFNRDFVADRVRFVYEGALEPSRFDLERFTRWYASEARKQDKRTARETVEMIIGKVSGVDLEKPLSDFLDQLKGETVDAFSRFDTANALILNVFNDESQQVYLDLFIEYKNGRDVLKLRKDQVGDLEISMLSAGEKNLFAMFADLSMRMIEANRTSFRGDANAAFRGTGIVLIDEIDLHLHPKWQKKVLSAFVKWFPNVQFVVTTHSPFVVQGSPIDQVSLFSLSSNDLVSLHDSKFCGKYLPDLVYEIFSVNPTGDAILDLVKSIERSIDAGNKPLADAQLVDLKAILDITDPVLLDMITLVNDFEHDTN